MTNIIIPMATAMNNIMVIWGGGVSVPATAIVVMKTLVKNARGHHTAAVDEEQHWREGGREEGRERGEGGREGEREGGRRKGGEGGRERGGGREESSGTLMLTHRS